MMERLHTLALAPASLACLMRDAPSSGADLAHRGCIIISLSAYDTSNRVGGP